MEIRYVTLTGADDSVKPSDLAKISAKYPFVEWGILFSQCKTGDERYPTLAWIDELIETAASEQSMNLSAHLCGKWVADILLGHFTFFRDEKLIQTFQRTQLNLGHKRIEDALNSDFIPLFNETVSDIQVILGGNYKGLTFDYDFFWKNSIFPMLDASGGRGIAEQQWLKPFCGESGQQIMHGYAGGLGPDNVVEEVEKIAQIIDDESVLNKTVWIDMETNLRTDGKFDLTKCEQVLEVVSDWAQK